ncbi:cytochrome c-type biogenesis protein CcmE homolog, mitochondrial-like [Salvia miltiorrhiza]|uniref:cytochrome c-type biogenesis protein CcmE homolog, mitochondrial-like n=1 Tax=Salvia miltiorrhiza TaxID=226208 RepID=UPI0025ACF388|nr:cytochrome c-type biogenesis protein CcmE homolog, mitochondrial-like [Salvia miltiorrhiza]
MAVYEAWTKEQSDALLKILVESSIRGWRDNSGLFSKATVEEMILPVLNERLSCIAGFIIIVLNQFQDQLVFYVTPTEALDKYTSDPKKSKFRLGDLVLENSVAQIPSSSEIQFVITYLITDILVKYEGSLPDLFCEGNLGAI